MPLPRTKLSQLLEMMNAADWRGALKLANSFGDLGNHKAEIQRGWAAIQNPDFYTEIGQDPAQLVAAGIAALRARYLKD